jgi:hypothetical protein
MRRYVQMRFSQISLHLPAILRVTEDQMHSARPRLCPAASCGKEPAGLWAKPVKQVTLTVVTKAAATRGDRTKFIVPFD